MAQTNSMKLNYFLINFYHFARKIMLLNQLFPFYIFILLVWHRSPKIHLKNKRYFPETEERIKGHLSTEKEKVCQAAIQSLLSYVAVEAGQSVTTVAVLPVISHIISIVLRGSFVTRTIYLWHLKGFSQSVTQGSHYINSPSMLSLEEFTQSSFILSGRSITKVFQSSRDQCLYPKNLSFSSYLISAAYYLLSSEYSWNMSE